MITTLDSQLAEQIINYGRDGFIIVRSVFTNSEVAELDTEARRLMGT